MAIDLGSYQGLWHIDTLNLGPQRMVQTTTHHRHGCAVHQQKKKKKLGVAFRPNTSRAAADDGNLLARSSHGAQTINGTALPF